MKKPFLFLTALLLLLSSCAGQAEDKAVGAGEETTAPIVETTSYEDIERRPTSGYKSFYYGFRSDSTLLMLSHPMEWKLAEADNGFDILRNGETVGALFGAPADDTADFTVLHTESHTKNGVRVNKYIEQRNADAVFRYRYVYEYLTDGHTRTVTLTADCAEIDDRNRDRLYMDVLAFDQIQSDTLGALASDQGDPSSILILGNSFISSSDIGNILTEMLQNDGRDCTVEAVSRGYANVGTYADDSEYLALIREGTHEFVFICGLYSQSQVKNLEPLKEACDDSGTTLVIFPAHNESADAVIAAESEYPELFCLNWKAELDGLILGGVDRWELCIDDAHDHSRPLAGYVGAHMIYRAIYGELPSGSMQYSIDQRHIDNILGNYAEVGDSQFFDEALISYLD